MSHRPPQVSGIAYPSADHAFRAVRQYPGLSNTEFLEGLHTYDE